VKSTFKLGALAACATILAASSAHAAVIDYIFTGVANGSLNGTGFTGASFTVTEVSNTTTEAPFGGGEIANTSTSATFSVGSSSGNLTGTLNEVVENQNSGQGAIIFGQVNSITGFAGEGLGNSFFETYGLTTGTSVISGTPSFISQTYATSAGNLIFTSASSTSFQAVIPGAGGVPEPASWALMVGGVGGIGAILRHTRRRRALQARSV
jgi:hypothetical protein